MSSVGYSLFASLHPVQCRDSELNFPNPNKNQPKHHSFQKVFFFVSLSCQPPLFFGKATSSNDNGTPLKRRPRCQKVTICAFDAKDQIDGGSWYLGVSAARSHLFSKHPQVVTKWCLVNPSQIFVHFSCHFQKHQLLINASTSESVRWFFWQILKWNEYNWSSYHPKLYFDFTTFD